MSESKFPKGWDAERVKKLIEGEERLSGDEQAAEDNSGFNDVEGQTVVRVPHALLPETRQLLAGYEHVRTRT